MRAIVALLPRQEEARHPARTRPKPAYVPFTEAEHRTVVHRKGSPIDVVYRHVARPEAEIRAFCADQGISLELHLNSPASS